MEFVRVIPVHRHGHHTSPWRDSSKENSNSPCTIPVHSINNAQDMALVITVSVTTCPQYMETDRHCAEVGCWAPLSQMAQNFPWPPCTKVLHCWVATRWYTSPGLFLVQSKRPELLLFWIAVTICGSLTSSGGWCLLVYLLACFETQSHVPHAGLGLLCRWGWSRTPSPPSSTSQVLWL